MNNAASSPPKPDRSLLTRSRQWHTWGGIFAAIFLLIVATSGIVLNYKQPVFSALGLEANPPKPAKPNVEQPESSKPQFTTRSGLASLPVGVDRVLELARAEWGDVPLERIELKDERGELIYKLKRKGGDELCVNAVTGAHFVKGGYERMAKGAAASASARQTDWGKILVDLHTGRIGGPAGKAVMSLAALVLLLLTFSGFYMWAKLLFSRRANSRSRLGARATTSVTIAMPHAPVLTPVRTSANASGEV